VEILLKEISIPRLASGQLSASYILNKQQDILNECVACLNTRLKVLTKEHDLNNSKQKITELLQIIKKNFLNNLKLYLLALNSDCKYKLTNTKRIVENPLPPGSLDNASIVRNSDELVDEVVLAQIRKETIIENNKKLDEKVEIKEETVVPEEDKDEEF